MRDKPSKTTQTFSKGDIVKVADDYPWITQGGNPPKVIAYKPGYGELAIVVGSYTDQYAWGGKDGRKRYTLQFEKHGKMSWYDEKYLTLVEKYKG